MLCERLAIQGCESDLRELLLAIHTFEHLEEYLAWEMSFPGAKQHSPGAEVLVPFDATTCMEVALRRVLQEYLEPHLLFPAIEVCLAAKVKGAPLANELAALANSQKWPSALEAPKDLPKAPTVVKPKKPVQSKQEKSAPMEKDGYKQLHALPGPSNLPVLQEHFKSNPDLEACQCRCFRIKDDILDSPLGSLVILNAVLANVQNQDVAEVWKRTFGKVWEEKQASGLDLKTDPKAMAFDSFVKASGLPSTKKKPQSSMAMLKRCYGGSRSFSVSPLVDFYNSLSVAHCVSCGGFDVEDLPGPFTKTVCIRCIYSMLILQYTQYK